MNFFKISFLTLLLSVVVACNHQTSSKSDEQIKVIHELRSELPSKKGSLFLPINENISKTPCPKLLPVLPNRTVNHYHDKMMSDTCDYYVYPKLGQFLYISSSSPTISATLISPTHHDFKNGAVEISESGRHIIQLTRSYHFGMSDISLLHSLKVVLASQLPMAEELQNDDF